MKFFYFSYGINVSLLQIYQKKYKTSFLISLSDAFLQQLIRAHSKCLHFFLLAKRKDGHMVEQSHIEYIPITYFFIYACEGDFFLYNVLILKGFMVQNNNGIH